MSDFFDKFRIETAPKTDDSHLLIFDDIRISVLTSSLLRVERSCSKKFRDEATQAVLFRDFDRCIFSSEISGGKLYIRTEKTEFCYSLCDYKMEYIVAGGRKVTDYKTGNLKGTSRTLDITNGSVKFGDGIISRSGVAVLDDSDSLVFTQDGHIVPGEIKEKDEYYFAYGHDYTKALHDYYALTGFTPLIPRYVLGTWWSRYKAYTQEEYRTLMERFAAEKIPITVATIDMDWHWVDVVGKFGKDSRRSVRQRSAIGRFYDTFMPGWTGYSWNTDLFPDHRQLLDWLHKNNYRVTLNLHPAAGVKFFENAYDKFCDFMKLDKTQRKPVGFDFSNDKFIEGYFEYLHHPLEREGVDFWWIDWQQGKNTGIPGLDPLWALNHYHTLDNAHDNNRPLILSRFAGAGSHRYPLGFSGDAWQTWKSLALQPVFTSTAANIGYTWWSHDIGGHNLGRKDDELYLRWVQFGVFSPILRLHSTSNEFMGKEPWKYRFSVNKLACDAIRLRHRLIPYIYTMNRRTASLGRALCEPMYYSYPEESGAYRVPNEYNFGSELTVCAVTEPMDSATNLARVRVWLPKGRFTDIFTGRVYNGGRSFYMYRDEGSIPVLAHEGSIIPLSVKADTNDTSNPAELELLIFRGNGSFEMYEDDGVTLDYKNGISAETVFEVSEKNEVVSFTINKASGDLSVIPAKRLYKLSFFDVADAGNAEVTVNGKPAVFETQRDVGHITLILKNIKPKDAVSVTLTGITARTSGSKKELLIELFSKIQMNNDLKQMRYGGFVTKNKRALMPAFIKGAVEEILQMKTEK